MAPALPERGTSEDPVFENSHCNSISCLLSVTSQPWIITLFPLEPLNKASGPFLWRHVERDPGQLRIDVEGALELQEIPVLHDHLSLRTGHTMLRVSGRKHIREGKVRSVFSVHCPWRLSHPHTLYLDKKGTEVQCMQQSAYSKGKFAALLLDVLRRTYYEPLKY